MLRTVSEAVVFGLKIVVCGLSGIGSPLILGEKWGLGVLKSVSKCENLEKSIPNLQKVAELRSNKFAKCVKRVKILALKWGVWWGRNWWAGSWR
jgi:hypothetical protein